MMEWMDIVPYSLILGGFIAAFWLFEKVLSPEKDTLDRIDRFFTRFLGPGLGFFMLILSFQLVVLLQATVKGIYL